MAQNIIVINVDLRETRVALIQDGVIAELHIERAAHRGTVGNVVLGRVTRVLPGMQAAFIDVGQERAAFLHVEDLIRPKDFDAYLAANSAILAKAIGGEAEKEPEEPEEPEEPAAEAETDSADEDGRGRGRRRRRSRRGRGGRGRTGSALQTADDEGAPALSGVSSDEDDTADDDGADEIAEAGQQSAEEDDSPSFPADGVEPAEAELEPTEAELEPEEVYTAPIEEDLDDDSLADGAQPSLDLRDILDLDEDDIPRGREPDAETDLDDPAGEFDSEEQDDFDEEELDDDDFDDELDGSVEAAGDSESDAGDLDEDAEAGDVGDASLESAESEFADNSADADDEQVGPEGQGDADAPEGEAAVDGESKASLDGSDEPPARYRRRRRRRRPAAAASGDAETTTEGTRDENEEGDSTKDDAARSRRRSRRGRSGASVEAGASESEAGASESEAGASESEAGEQAEAAESTNEDSDARRGSSRRRRGRRRRRGGAEEGDTQHRGSTKATPAIDGYKVPQRIARSVPISEVVKEGNEVVVQISKEPIGTKGARVTSHVSLPGRYAVYLPTVEHTGISKRIGQGRERSRLRKVIDSLKPPTGGLIVRTVAEGLTKKQLKADVGYLIRVWADIAKKRKGARPRTILYEELDLVLKVARDLFTDEVVEVIIDDKDQYGRLARFVEMFMPARVKDIKLYTGDDPIFDEYGIEEEIKRALSRKVPLPSGGSLIMDQAEALTAIDVNTGRYVGKGSKDLEETALKTNLEAVDEIAQQLRFRNIGGLVILDLIDMERAENREKVWRALERRLLKDKAKTTINRISDLGLIEMTRKRTRESLGRTMHESCFYCDGTGHVQSRETIAYEILRQIHRERHTLSGYSVKVSAHPAVVDFLRFDAKDALVEAEKRYQRRIELVARQEYHIEQYDMQGR